MLTVKAEENPECHFAPLEHPRLVLGKRIFETTHLDKEQPIDQEPPVEGAELIRKVSFAEVASNVLVTRAIYLRGERGRYSFEEVKNLLDKVFELWPQNREAYALLYTLAHDFFDAELAKETRRCYQEIGGDDSRYWWNLYQMAEDESFLSKALQKFPAHMEAFAEIAKIKARQNPRDASFDFAVASWCIARSRALDLGIFYINNVRELGQLFGKEKILKILRGFASQKRNNYLFHLAMYDLDGNDHHLKTIIKEGLMPLSLLGQYWFYARAKGLGNEYLAKFQELDEKYTRFRQILGLE